jgi:hypothetical protein
VQEVAMDKEKEKLDKVIEATIKIISPKPEPPKQPKPTGR